MASINNKNSLSGQPTSHQHVFELFLFVNPMGSTCLNCEKEILSFIENTDKKVYFRFITYHDFHLFNEYLKSQNMKNISVEERNTLYQAMYRISLGYKAALLQGKKIGRAFLMKMQKHFGEQREDYSSSRMKELTRQIPRLDVEMWEEDIESGLAKRDYASDINIARQMNIKKYPSLVIFDNLNFRYGVRIEEPVTAESLELIMDQMIHTTDEYLFEYEESAYKKGEDNKRAFTKINCEYLRILEQ